MKTCYYLIAILMMAIALALSEITILRQRQEIFERAVIIQGYKDLVNKQHDMLERAKEVIWENRKTTHMVSTNIPAPW
jgi:hypothetical protein